MSAIGHAAERVAVGVDRRCQHGVVDPDWCYDCFYDETPEADNPLIDRAEKEG